MAVQNGLLASTSQSVSNILQTVGNFPYLQANVNGPETTGVADVLTILPGDLLTIDPATLKISQYKAGVSTTIYGIASDAYNSTALEAADLPAGQIDLYLCGHIRKSEVHRLNAAGTAREAVDFADTELARKQGLYIN